jgi:hypothetical protein
MKKASLLIALTLLSITSVETASAAAKFEGASIPGTSKANSGFFRINVATGQVEAVWGNTTATFTAIKDTAPVPAGEYHLYVAPDPQADGNCYWMLNRMDANTGHVWSLAGGGDAPYSWTDVQPPK